ncbi:Sialidase-1 [Holothuria leucospilota]|uniref:Sialidase-1 n=1 Tax=Holothuria leucospilota TaxID=206669 RepID=A0A9Q1C5L6_HOLLE|nr:Sialidase-1 [Holothuria leucospilota]
MEVAYLLLGFLTALFAGKSVCLVDIKAKSNVSKPVNSTKYSGVVPTPQVQPLVVVEEVLWQSGEAEVGIYRCPLITYTPGGNLLAVAEGRKSNGDADLKFIATKRSTDGGFEWGIQKFIHNDQYGESEDNLGAVLVDDIMKEIYIFYVTCAHPSACSSSSTPSLMYVKSVDDGISWKLPKKFAPHKGRLIVCGHGGELSVNGNFCLLSDDHGLTWRWGAEMLPIPAYTTNQKGDFVPDECQPIELPDGSMMLNTRNQYHYHCNCRMVSRSYDGMETIDLETVYFDTTLIEPAVAASIVSHWGMVFFSNPASETSRTNMMVKWSFDNGTTWPGRLPIWDLASGYSCMTAFPDTFEFEKRKYLYLLFEKGKTSYTETISFVKISLRGII